MTEKSLDKRLQQRRRDGLYRSRRLLQSPQQPELQLDGRSMLAFCSNDYLGLANHPELKAAMHAGIDRWGAGSGAAHLISGHSAAHHALEEELAEFTGRERALLFSTGYMANLGVLAALTDRGDTIFQDRLNHASLIDGGLLSRARLRRYPHADLAVLERLLADTQSGRRLIATDGVFSMDGDLAPLGALARLAKAHDAWLMVDDAHGLGVLGEHGGGSLEQFGLDAAEVPILMGTLGKGLGSFGAFVAGSESLIEPLIQQARPYVYTTASPPALAEATRAALRIVQSEPWRRQRLAELIARFRQGAQQLGLPLMASQTPIQPIVAGAAATALAWSRQLETAGILLSAIRPPTVPEGSARLRVTLSAAHTDEQLDRLLDALAQLRPEGL
ncbi:8-amino-7-oxononanoate synthase [Candidatus Endoriftia persephonae]|jgi:8-amino-7-oxononanoate synthase|uniref:8-amino-7-oxononanoate synthase n=2 Tax=Gammaproteobacteria TaxID=1236 RepID=G2FAZ7_9GAMM|nr:8-amino-7-oxononanoate synthase [Candidatus Endoriftia persephone]EGW55935.1 8-amino-7-oxononanoate synthase [endosymbiont of Tevnia jerichonana (vent Tica)]USF88070.1 8-amino-7-oxononanoate synthase [Candidatus Endoriftia persephone]